MFSLVGAISSNSIESYLSSSLGIFFVFRLFTSIYVTTVSAILGPTLVIGTTELFSRYTSLVFSNLINLNLFFINLFCIFTYLLFRSKHQLPLLGNKQIKAVLVLIAPSAITLFILLVGGNIFGNNLTWLLYGDAQTNTSSILEIFDQNGFSGGFPVISNGVIAYFLASNNSFNLENINFVQLLQTEAFNVVFMWCTASVLFGLIALKEFSGRNQLFRYCLTFFSALLPFSWWALNFSLVAGFFNTPFILCTFAMTWIYWRDLLKPNATISATLLFVLACVFALLAWPPLLILPLIFALYSLALIFPKNALSSAKTWIIIGVILLLITSFLFIVIYPRASSVIEFASVDGYILNVSLYLTFFVVFWALTVALLSGAWKFIPGSASLGLLLFGIGTTSGLVALFFMGNAPGEPLLWHYYPRKFAWLSIFFLLFISALVGINSDLYKNLKSTIQRIGIWVLLLGVFASASVLVYKANNEQQALFPFVNIGLYGKDAQGTIPAIEQALGNKEIRLQYDSNDYIVNQWVFQWKKYSSDTKIWTYAYSLIQAPEDVCSAAAEWGGNVSLLTKSETVEKAVLSQCSDLISTIVN